MVPQQVSISSLKTLNLQAAPSIVQILQSTWQMYCILWDPLLILLDLDSIGTRPGYVTEHLSIIKIFPAGTLCMQNAALMHGIYSTTLL